MRDTLTRLLERAPQIEASPTGDPENPSVSLAWLLRMARRTRDARPAPVGRDQITRLERALADRPGRDEALGQLHVDAASCIRRARHLSAGPVVAVGDDDAVTIALRQLGRDDVCAVDLDPRLLAFLRERGVETHRADVLEEPVPEALRGRFAAAVTDPFRDLDGGLGFLCFAAACLRAGGALYWVDDPLWNPEHHAVRASMAALGWRVVETHHEVHAYPLSHESFDPDEIVRSLGVDRRWLETLIDATCAWTHLYRFARVTESRSRALLDRGALDA